MKETKRPYKEISGKTGIVTNRYTINRTNKLNRVLVVYESLPMLYYDTHRRERKTKSGHRYKVLHDLKTSNCII